MINTTKNTAAEEAAIITTVGNELLLSSVIAMVGMNTVVEDPGLEVPTVQPSSVQKNENKEDQYQMERGPLNSDTAAISCSVDIFPFVVTVLRKL